MNWVHEAARRIKEEQAQREARREWTLYRARVIAAWSERLWQALLKEVRADGDKWNGEWRNNPERQLSITTTDRRCVVRVGTRTVAAQLEFQMIRITHDDDTCFWIDIDMHDDGVVQLRRGRIKQMSFCWLANL